jgi:L-asparaginase
MNKPAKLKEGKDTKVLIIYTGGTLGMVYDTNSENLVPFAFSQIIANVPELARLKPEIHYLAFEKPIDSSNIQPENWVKIVEIIQENHEAFSGFVILHGTDTMAYTASALSFMIQNLQKPIVITGAQLPIGIPRTDARENLITAIEIAGDPHNVVPEVCIYFNGRLLRGNRAKKRESSQFDAFDSENYPYLAEIGVSIDYNLFLIKKIEINKKPIFHTKLNTEIGIVKLFPGLSSEFLSHQFSNKNLKGIILESYGSGNAPSEDWFVDVIQVAINKGIMVLNVSQCTGGHVRMGKYETSQKLKNMGVISGEDMTIEAAITKLMWVLALEISLLEKKVLLEKNIAGELTFENK